MNPILHCLPIKIVDSVVQTGKNYFLNKTILSVVFAVVISTQVIAQDSTALALGDTLSIANKDSIPVSQSKATDSTTPKTLTPQQVKKRVKIVAATNIVGYSAILLYLNQAWYADYPRSKFHFFDDNGEWLQVDKVGHMFGAYIESRASYELWKWSGISHNKAIWLGGLSGVAYQSIIEVLDGFSAEWGFSWGDFSANVAGSAIFIGQQFGWNEQRIKIKFSSHIKNYSDPELQQRADEIFGSSAAQRYIKDYNAQTYWASVNLKSFLPTSNLPPWLAIAVGYGADGMFGANENVGYDSEGNVTFDRRDVKRYRQWYLAPDVDFTKIKTNSKAVRFLLTVLSAFKFPTPSLEFSNGKFKVVAMHF